MNKGIGHVAEACGASTEDRKAIEGALNVLVGSVGAVVDPLGGCILITRGVIQMARADNVTSDAASLGMEVASAKFHDKAIEIAAQAAADNLLNWM